MTDSKFHPKFPDFKHVGSVDVDAGVIWIGDPCYILQDRNENRPKDFGEDWGDIVNTFFERSGYSAQTNERYEHDNEARNAWVFSEEHMKIRTSVHAPDKTEDPEAYENHIDYMVKVMSVFMKKWKEENPFVPKTPDTHVAEYKHDGGHTGMGIMMSTNFGDGSYPVYIEYDERGRPSRAMIDFFGDASPFQDED